MHAVAVFKLIHVQRFLLVSTVQFHAVEHWLTFLSLKLDHQFPSGLRSKTTTYKSLKMFMVTTYTLLKYSPYSKKQLKNSNEQYSEK